uniref:Uncharacterized protein n=2 Tax=Choreotrichia TaxID=141411 RepID=A0A7S3WH34_9SPIT|mmetsp:Transcript_22355/g.68059  ORF Transcript_22355/g.68059 Transcript_22355/m.68059 type:complete len:266 (+) Transcript_22355:186-983(+)
MTMALLLALSAASGYLVGVPGASVAARCVGRASCACQAELPPEAMESIPPAALADAWRKDEKAKELGETLKGCSLYVIGTGGAKLQAVGRIFARRLPNYRFYSVPDLMCSTYSSLAPDSAAADSLGVLYEAETLDDVQMLARAIMDQVQQYTRSVVQVWEGAVTNSDFAVMQQGIVVRVVGPRPDHPNAGGDIVASARAEWEEKHGVADVTVDVAADIAPDDIVYAIVEGLLEFIRNHPGKSEEWKAKSEALLEQGWSLDNPPSP